MFNRMGGSIFNMGTGTIQPGVNFFNQILQGNQPATAALLQPNINDITSTQNATLRAINTLMPRGGGRYASLFGQSLVPQAQIENLFNPLRGQAASALPGIGLQETGQGVNLFGLGNQALQAATGANVPLMQGGLTQQQMNNQLLGGLGSGLLGLATLPLGGGTLLGSALGGLGGLFGGGGGFNPMGSVNLGNINAGLAGGGWGPGITS
jgi:hypothetical protein